MFFFANDQIKTDNVEVERERNWLDIINNIAVKRESTIVGLRSERINTSNEKNIPSEPIWKIKGRRPRPQPTQQK